MAWMLNRAEQRVNLSGAAGWLGRVLQHGAVALGPRRSAKSLAVEDTLWLGAKRQLLVVRCGSERFLIAANHDGLTAIQPLAEQAAPCEG